MEGSEELLEDPFLDALPEGESAAQDFGDLDFDMENQAIIEKAA